MDGGGWGTYWNSIQLAALTAVIGTAILFIGAYMVEKIDGPALAGCCSSSLPCRQRLCRGWFLA